ncbi:MAG: hypothetical protein C0402_08650 [Thermodesulfovibrio sp.]|nr:hypothetical protein [Thermodesulfovibrio sp.]
MKKIILAAVFFFSLAPRLSQASLLVGGDSVYTVKKGDTIELIGARLGVSSRQLAQENNLDPKKPLKQGTSLKVNTRRIVPLVVENGIVINIPDRTLYYFRAGQVDTMFPVALGMVPRKDADWTTPQGKFTVLRKEKNPSWYVPKSIQAEMEAEGKEVETVVPPGPTNPLGRYAIKTSIAGILIHETIKPQSVYHFRSHGCVRVMPEHMEKFFERVEVNTQGELVYLPVKVALSPEGRVFLEAHGDFYKKIKDLKAAARKEIEARGLLDSVDWEKVEKVLKDRDGVPRDITKSQEMTYQARRDTRGQRRAD